MRPGDKEKIDALFANMTFEELQAKLKEAGYMTPAEMQLKITKANKIIQQAKYSTVEACLICERNAKLRDCDKCHVRKLQEMVKGWGQV